MAAIQRRFELLDRVEERLQDALALVDAPMPSNEAGYAFSQAPSYPLIGLARYLEQGLQFGWEALLLAEAQTPPNDGFYRQDAGLQHQLAGAQGGLQVEAAGEPERQQAAGRGAGGDVPLLVQRHVVS